MEEMSEHSFVSIASSIVTSAASSSFKADSVSFLPEVLLGTGGGPLLSEGTSSPFRAFVFAEAVTPSEGVAALELFVEFPLILLCLLHFLSLIWLQLFRLKAHIVALLFCGIVEQTRGSRPVGHIRFDTAIVRAYTEQSLGHR